MNSRTLPRSCTRDAAYVQDERMGPAETGATADLEVRSNVSNRIDPSASCVFCQIVQGASAASMVATGSTTVAFLDILPVNEGHALVIPRRHAAGLADLREEEGAEMFEVGRRIAAAQRAAGLAEAVNLFLADGEIAGQEIFHAHLHVLARRSNDGMSLGVDYPPAPTRAALDRTAERLASLLGAAL
jgi:histidine triad (HIT) family protein